MGEAKAKARSKTKVVPEDSDAIPGWVVAMVVGATAAGLVPALSTEFRESQVALKYFPPPLAVNVILSGIGCLGCLKIIPHFRDKFIKAGLFGIDLNKTTTERDSKGVLVRPYNGIKVPEAMGVISGMVFLVLMFFYIPFAFAHYYGDVQKFPHHKLTEFVAALLSIACMCFLGFADNVLDLRWRHKILLPTAATLPLLMVYWVNGGVTYVTLPNILRPITGTEVVYLGVLYYVYMGMLSVFCTNAINILAGVNGLEVGQSVVIGLSVLANSILQLQRLENETGRENHLFAVVFMIPFLATSFSLLYHNWWPSRVFVGDTFCYFAGMTFAVVAILGHFSKTLLLFFIPQIVNFLYSCPQLFKLIPCPRHRMPSLDAKSGRIGMSFCEFKVKELPALGKVVYKVFKTLRLVYIEEKKDGLIRMNNLTLINFTLYTLGPLREDWLTISLLIQQLIGSAIAFMIRYKLAAVFYAIVE